MKILFFISSLSNGGAEKVVSLLANYLSTIGYQVTILTLETTNSFYSINSKVKIIGLNELEPTKGLFKKMASLIKRLWKIRQQLSIIKPQIAISFITESNVKLILSSVFLPIKTIISDRANPTSASIPFIWRLLSFLTYRFSGMLVVQTNAVATLYKNYHVKTCVVKNPITFNPRPTIPPAKKKIITSVGRLVKSKRFDLVIQAFKESGLQGWELFIIGDGPEYQNLKHLSKEIGIYDQVHFTGRINNVKEILDQSSIFLFMSETEGFPNALLEAMAAGLPCISTACKFGPPEMIQHGFSGELIPVNDIYKAKNAIIKLSIDETLRSFYGKNAQEYANNCSIENIAIEWENIFLKIKNMS